MNDSQKAQRERSLPPDLEAIASLIDASAQQRRGDAQALLTLLRLLEALHRDIQDGLFQDCLPDNRQALYKMLRDMEAEGGWPYIPRMRLRTLIEHIEHLLPEYDEDGSSTLHGDSSNQ